MFYKIRNDILFRKYRNHGYITDNSEYGYHMLDDKSIHPGELYLSESGAIMLSLLSKTPRDIDSIVNELCHIFEEVEFNLLKHDTVEFFDNLVTAGFLSKGKTEASCIDQKHEQSIPGSTKTSFTGTDCSDSRNNVSRAEDINGNDGLGDYKIDQDDFLRSIHLDITDACNERCVHCYIPTGCKKHMIAPSLFYKIIDEGVDLNIIHVTFSGGEPLLHKDIISFLQYCRKADLSVNVLSNLQLLTDEIIAEMQLNPLLSVQTSVYSMDAAIHDAITTIDGSLVKTLEGIDKLLAAKIPVQISCPLMKQNYHCYADVLHWGQAHNIAVAFEPILFAAYDHSGVNVSNRLSLKELETALEIQLHEGLGSYLYQQAEEKKHLQGKDPICSICRYSFCVRADGKVFPCVGWQANVFADLNQQSMSDIWKNSAKIKELRQIKRSDFVQCVDCLHRGYCNVCMMWNANENQDGDPFRINSFYCQVAALTHKLVENNIKVNK